MNRHGISIRLKLTLAYSALFLLTSAGLLALINIVVHASESRSSTVVGLICRLPSDTAPTVPSVPVTDQPEPTDTALPSDRQLPVDCSGKPAATVPPVAIKIPPGGVLAPTGVATRPELKFIEMYSLAKRTQSHTLHTLLVASGFALLAMSVVSLGLGWIVSGRVLRPVLQITETAQRISQETLHQRIDYRGPKDELATLANTFDGMLARLEAAFTSQRNFVANASHELRTPLATERVLVDEALAHPAASNAELRSTLAELRRTNQDSEHLLDALLTLARSERGLERRAPVDLSGIVTEAVASVGQRFGDVDLDLTTDIHAAPTTGDVALLRRLVDNLLDNAVKYSGRPATIHVTTGTSATAAFLTVTNGGEHIASEDVAGLFEPFRRGASTVERTGSSVGLGLTIVRGIAQAHDGSVSAEPGTSGGLAVTVSLPVARR